MAIPSGSGSEVLKRGTFTVTSTTDTKILDGVANHIYTVLSIIITETAGNSETFGLFLDPSAGGTDYEIVSLATALASNVLPVPGGPCSKTPLGASIFSLSNNSG